MRRRRACLGAALVVLSGCGSLQFSNDHRLAFASPQARHRVTTPLTVSWTMKDFTASGQDGSTAPGAGSFVVLVDTSPMPAGEDLRWLGRNDPACMRDAACPTPAYLAALNVYVTTDLSLTLKTLPKAKNGVGDEQHYVNVVLVDGTGHRIGESAWYLPFTSKRRTSS